MATLLVAKNKLWGQIPNTRHPLNPVFNYNDGGKDLLCYDCIMLGWQLEPKYK